MCQGSLGCECCPSNALASVVTERDLVYHLNKVAIEQKKVDIAEDREMNFLSALPESMLHTMAIDAFMSRKNIGGQYFSCAGRREGAAGCLCNRAETG